MLELPHTVLGATIGTKIANPLVSIPLALASHFLLDFIPHWNPNLYTETKKYGRPTKRSTVIVAIDTLTSLIVGLLLASRFWPNLARVLGIIFACFAAVAADVSEGPYFFLGIRSRFLERWVELQHRHQKKTSKIPGLLIQGLIIILVLLIILA